MLETDNGFCGRWAGKLREIRPNPAKSVPKSPHRATPSRRTQKKTGGDSNPLAARGRSRFGEKALDDVCRGVIHHARAGLAFLRAAGGSGAQPSLCLDKQPYLRTVALVRNTPCGDPLEGIDAWRRARADGSYASANDPRVLLGLGDCTDVTAVRAHWPNGGVEGWTDISTDRYTTLREGSGEVVQ